MKRLLPFLIFVGLLNLQVFAAETYPRKIVMEEATGTWCGWCVRGIETLKLMSENYPDNFIGIGIHAGDEMAGAENYDLYEVGNVNGYPTCFINRRTKDAEGVSYNTAYYAVQESKDAAEAKVEASAFFTDATKASVKVKTQTTFGNDISAANYKIAYVVLEDNVGPYYQSNYYSGESYDPSYYMYGWTQKDSYVSMQFNDVARGIYPSVHGQEGSVPSTVKMGKANDYEFTLTLPASVSNVDNISIVTLLINSASGEIVNADKVAVKEAIAAKVKLNKSKATLVKGKTLTLKATITPADLTDKSVTWKSSNKKIAKVSSKGKVTGLKAGKVTITCTSKATGAKATCKVTVIEGVVTLNKTELFIEKGAKKTLKATVTPTTLDDKSVTWTTSNKKIATVSSSGKVKGVKYGTAVITCTSVATGATATCTVTVGDVALSKSELSVKKGKTAKLTATVYPTTLDDKSVTWTSSNKKIATVSSAGKVKGIKAGTVTITCTSVATGLSATCTVTVVNVSSTRSLEGDDDDETTGIESLEAEPAEAEPFDVYDLSGRKVLSHVTSLDGLPNGIYIVDGKKVLKKD